MIIKQYNMVHYSCIYLTGRQIGARQNQQGVSSGSQSYSGGGGGGGGGRGHEEPFMGGPPGSIDAQMALALIRLQQDMNRVMERVTNLEKAQTEQVCHVHVYVN